MNPADAKKGCLNRILRIAGHLSFWAALSLFLALLSLLCGSSWLSVPDMLQALSDPQSTAFAILFHVRLPRMLACLICGPALAVAGYLLQSLLQNPLAAPHSMGLQAGSGLAVAACGLFPGLMPSSLAAFLGCLLGGSCILYLASRARASRTTLILAGLAMSQIFSAGIDLIVTLDSDALIGYTQFKIGSLSGLSLRALLLPALLIVLASSIAMLCSRQLEVLSLGTEAAGALGMNASLWMKGILVLVSLLTASVVSLAGLIGFIGLIVPHLVKRTMPGNAARQLAGCIFQGASLLTGCDLLARTLFTPFEIPDGIVLSLLGGPYFLWLLFGLRKRNISNALKERARYD